MNHSAAETARMHDPFRAPPRSPVGRAFDDQSDAAERTYALFTHLVGFASFASAGVPLLGLIGTLIMWRIKKDESPFLDDHGREATNFQLSLTVYYVICGAFTLITFGFGAILAVPVIAATLVLAVIGQIRGAMAANRGEFYRYPCCIRFLKAADEG